MNCNICGGLGYTHKENKKEDCICLRWKRFYGYAPDLVKSLLSLDIDSRKEIQKTFDGVGDKAVVKIKETTDIDYINSLILFFILSHSKKDYVRFNVFKTEQLVEIWLGKNKAFPSLSDIVEDLVVFEYGFHILPNKEHVSAFIQSMENLRLARSKCLVIEKFNGTALNVELEKYFKTFNWDRINLSTIDSKDDRRGQIGGLYK